MSSLQSLLDEVEAFVQGINVGTAPLSLPTPPPTPPATPPPTRPSLRVSIPFRHTMPETGRLIQRSVAVTQRKWAALLAPPPPLLRQQAARAKPHPRRQPTARSTTVTSQPSEPTPRPASAPTPGPLSTAWPPTHQLPSVEAMAAALADKPQPSRLRFPQTSLTKI